MKNKALLYVILVSLAFIFITAGSFLTHFSTAQNQTGSASAYFSPDGGIRDRIISKINLSKKALKYPFTVLLQEKLLLPSGMQQSAVLISK